ncbi:MAG: 50S ribosomal protein L11 [Verrucomicrobia bacterium]|nr:50S ribosomal protein L11 [Verrucomicrobiota bacterium]
MAKKKKIVKVVRLQIPAGKATPAPPIGPALGAAGVNIMAFCKDFNAKTSGRTGENLPVVINVYQDKTFDFYTKEPPVADKIKKYAGIGKGSGVPNRDKVGKITLQQVEEIAKEKAPDLNSHTVASAMEMVKGTARSMGVEITA